MPTKRKPRDERFAFTDEDEVVFKPPEKVLKKGEKLKKKPIVERKAK